MNRVTAYSLVGGLLLVSALIAEAADAQAPAAAGGDTNRSAAPEAYRIGPEDVLQISVWRTRR